MSDSLKNRITEAMKQAMRAKDKARLSTIRLILAEFKRIEVDERIELDDPRALSVLDKMCKQRRDAITQFATADRQDLVDQEESELKVITEFMPAALSDNEIDDLVSEAIQQTNASSMQDMGKVMGKLKPQLQGRADMSVVSKRVKTKLN